MTDTSQANDGKLHVSVRYGGLDEPANGRVYAPGVLEAAMKRAQENGTMEVTVMPDPLTGKGTNAPVELGGKRFLNPKFTLQSMSMQADGSLQGSFEVEERAGVVDRLADVAREED